MENNSPLPFLGFVVCSSASFGASLGLLDTLRDDNFVSIIKLLSVLILGLCVMLGVLWVVCGSSYNWQSATEEERAAFLNCEQGLPDDNRKSQISLFVFMLVIYGVTATLFYGEHWLWKPPVPPFALFMGATAISDLCAFVAALLWWKACDHRLRATRVSG